MDQKIRLDNLKKYMLREFGVTPENIDQKIVKLKEEFYKKTEKERRDKDEKDKVL